MIVTTAPRMTPAQQERQEQQVQWLAAALRPQPALPATLDERSLRIARRCPTCGASLMGGRDG